MTATGPDTPEPTPGSEGPTVYLAEHIHSALATDHRVHEQGIEVTVVGAAIVLRGTVATPAQRDAASAVARELAPDAEIVNDLEVPPAPEPDGVEEIG